MVEVVLACTAAHCRRLWGASWKGVWSNSAPGNYFQTKTSQRTFIARTKRIKTNLMTTSIGNTLNNKFQLWTAVMYFGDS